MEMAALLFKGSQGLIWLVPHKILVSVQFLTIPNLPTNEWTNPYSGFLFIDIKEQIGNMC